MYSLKIFSSLLFLKKKRKNKLQIKKISNEFSWAQSKNYVDGGGWIGALLWFAWTNVVIGSTGCDFCNDLAAWLTFAWEWTNIIQKKKRTYWEEKLNQRKRWKLTIAMIKINAAIFIVYSCHKFRTKTTFEWCFIASTHFKISTQTHHSNAFCFNLKNHLLLVVT